MVALLLAFAALIARPDARGALAWLLLLLGGGAMMGTPILDVLYKIPAFQFANPRRFVFLIVIAFSVLASIGAERLARKDGARRPLAFAAILGPALLALLIIVLAWPETLIDRITADGMDDLQAPWVALWFRAHAVTALIVLSITAVGIWVASRVGPAVGIGVLLAVLAADLSWFHAGTNPGQDGTAPVFPRTEVIGWLRERHGDLASAPAADGSGLFRVLAYKNPATDFPQARGDLPPLSPNMNNLFEIQSVQGYEAITDRHIEELMELVEPGVSREHHYLRELRRPESLGSPILDLMGVRYVMSPAQALPGTQLVPLAEATMLRERMALHERPNALPRFQMPVRVDVVADEDAVRRRMGSRDFDPASVAVMLAEDARVLGLGSGTWTREGEAAQLTLTSYRPAAIDLEYRASTDTVLLIADTFHPGWLAYADGEELPVVRGDHAFRMLLLPAGQGTLRLVFRPTTLTLGAVAAVVGVMMLLAWVLFARRRAGARSRPAETAVN